MKNLALLLCLALSACAGTATRSLLSKPEGQTAAAPSLDDLRYECVDRGIHSACGEAARMLPENSPERVRLLERQFALGGPEFEDEYRLALRRELGIAR